MLITRRKDAEKESSCRICLQSRSEIDRSLACFLGLLLICRKINALISLRCDCSVGSMRYICYSCLQKYEADRGRRCDLCHKRLFPGAGPRRLLQAVFWLKFSALSALALLLILVSIALYNPGQSVSALLAGGFVASCALLVSLCLAILLAVQFRRGDCPQDCSSCGLRQSAYSPDSAAADNNEEGTATTEPILPSALA